MKPYNEYDKLLGTERHKEQTMEDSKECARRNDERQDREMEQRAGKPLTWELIDVTKEPEWIQDKSGVYTVIHRTRTMTADDGAIVRLDLMESANNKPIRSWQGTAAAVRKAAIRWLEEYSRWGDHDSFQDALSYEHISYIGEQLALAAVLPDFVQD